MVLLNLLKKLFYLTFGILAFLFSGIILAWILFNLFSSTPSPEFARSVDGGALWKLFRILSGIGMCIGMFAVGVSWIEKSQVSFLIKKLFGGHDNPPPDF